VVELDGFEFHRTRAAFERDRRRDEVLALAGYHVLRITWRRLTDKPASVISTLRRLLANEPPAVEPEY
jgi:very-short-patch-repair endonuclease